jgi:phage gpG-like protein
MASILGKASGGAHFSFSLDGVEVFNRAFNRIDQLISDFRSIWPNVAREFYAIEADQFGSEGAKGASGKWAPLSPAYKKWKDTHFPGEPLLRLHRPLVESLTSPDALGSIYRLDADEMTLGSKVEYATAHQRGGGNLPARPPISFTTEDKRKLQKSIQSGLVRFTRQAGFQVDERLAA